MCKQRLHRCRQIDESGNVDASKNTGNIARQTLSFNGLAQPFIQSYKYDSLYRLTDATETNNGNQTWKETYSYDHYGNRVSHAKFQATTQLASDNHTDPTIDPNTNRFDPNQGYTYDKGGNLTVDAEGRGFTFNADNKQTKVVENGKTVGEYFYDGEGKRVKKLTYDEGGSLQDVTVFVYSSGKLVAEYSTKPLPQSPTTSYTATDKIGSPSVITNSLGEVVSRRDFMPFGEAIALLAGLAPKEQYDLCGFDFRTPVIGPYIAQDPTDLSAFGYSNGVNTIKFKGNNSLNSVVYEIWRRQGDTGEWTLLAITKKQTFTDAPVKPGQYYEYKTRAKAAKTISHFSNSAVVYGV